MTTYNSPQVRASGGADLDRASGVSPGDGGDVKVLRGSVSITAAPTASDVYHFFTAPKGFRIEDGWLKNTGMDSNTTLAFDVGDADSEARLFSAVQGYTASCQVLTLVGAFGHKFTEDTPIYGTVQATPGTGAAGTLSMCLRGVIEGVSF